MTKRLQADLKGVQTFDSQGNPPFYAVLEREDDLNRWLVLICGPSGTPYQHGFFVFTFQFEAGNGESKTAVKYPFSPPRVLILTTADGRTRMNPNLYAQGKVCLSILGTWSAGGENAWSPTLNVVQVIQSIQAMVMTEKPYHNEPGFEESSSRAKRDKSGACAVAEYSQKITHEVIRVAVCEHMECILSKHTTTTSTSTAAHAKSSAISSAGFSKTATHILPFATFAVPLFLLHYSRYVAVCESFKSTLDGKKFTTTAFEHAGNTAEGTFGFQALQNRLDAAYRTVVSWLDDVARPEAVMADSVIINTTTTASAAGEPLVDNQFRYVLSVDQLPVSVFGTTTDAITVEILYPRWSALVEGGTLQQAASGLTETASSTTDMPVVRVLRGATPQNWHPHITTQNSFVHWTVAAVDIAWVPERRVPVEKVAAAVRKLLRSEPNNAESSWVNYEAGRQYFSDRPAFLSRVASGHSQQPTQHPHVGGATPTRKGSKRGRVE